MIFGLAFLVFYLYISLLNLIPSIFASLSMFVFVSTVYSSTLYNIIFEFSSFDLLNQNMIVIFLFSIVITLFSFKSQLKCMITVVKMKFFIQMMSIMIIHLCLYEKNMSAVSSFLYGFSFAYIFWELSTQYLKVQYEY